MNTDQQINYLIEKIQLDIVSDEIALSSILLKAKLLAFYLKSEKFKLWVENEINGYSDSDSVPAYRKFSPPALGYLSNGIYAQKNTPISLANLPEEIKDTFRVVRFTEGIPSVESIAARKDSVSFDWPADFVQVWNHYNKDNLGTYYCLQVNRPTDPSVFSQILITVRSRLQDFVLEVSDLPWKISEESRRGNDSVDRIFVQTVLSVNNSQEVVQEKNMTSFNQSGQTVNSQNNAGGDINIAGDINAKNIQNDKDFIHAIQKLKKDLLNASENGVLDAELVADVDFELASSIQEARKELPNKELVITPMEKAKKMLSDASVATEFITALMNLIAVGLTVF
jgi:hypothetical protein